MRAFTAVERPELVEPAVAATSDAFPEYNSHGDVIDRYWGRLVDERPEFQLHLVGDGDVVLARIRSLPLRWNGTLDDLPAGIDGAIARGFDEGGANVLCAMVIMIPRPLQGRGISRLALDALSGLAHAHGLEPLIAPVRPSWKERYPLVPIERYAAWRRGDGLLFDPWLRVHERAGAAVLRPEPRSLRITGSVSEWERWLGMPLPEDGEYTFPGGLAPLVVARGTGRYWEPNVWVRHPPRG